MSNTCLLNCLLACLLTWLLGYFEFSRFQRVDYLVGLVGWLVGLVVFPLNMSSTQLSTMELPGLVSRITVSVGGIVYQDLEYDKQLKAYVTRGDYSPSCCQNGRREAPRQEHSLPVGQPFGELCQLCFAMPGAVKPTPVEHSFAGVDNGSSSGPGS
jgi:hypothetical protein